MELCLWCTPSPNDAAVTAVLKRYCNGDLTPEEMQEANNDLTVCPECVVEYHRARERVPALHKRLWELETARLLQVFREMLEADLEDCDLYFVDDGHEEPVSKFSPEDFYNRLRFPLMEVLKYPYLLCHRDLCETVVNMLCKMEDMKNPLPVIEPNQGTYLLMVHPNERVRRWAIATARSLGRVDRDNYYNLQEVFSCMFRILDLGITLDFINEDDSYISGKLQLLPPHLYDSKNKKHYWLGICMLLMQLDSQAMVSLLMGPEGQASIPQCIINTMNDSNKDDEGSDPFWPALHCFLVILDRLGSKVWGQIEQLHAFQAITRAGSYREEIEAIRKKTTGTRVKVESENDDDLLSCSQIVYDCYAVARTSRTSDWSSGNSDTSGNAIFEEMSCLVNVLQSEMGQGMRVYGSTFLWFIPFVRSIMELTLPNSICIGEVIHYLEDNVNKDVLSGRTYTCDKVTEFFIRILVDIIELLLSKGCMKILSYFSHIWVDVIMQCAALSDDICNTRVTPRSGVHSASLHFVRGTRMAPTGVGAMSQASVKLILLLLKEGGRTGTVSECAKFRNLIKIHQRDGSGRGWTLPRSEYKNLKKCLLKVISERHADSNDILPCAPPTPPADPSENVPSFPNPTLAVPLQQIETKDAGVGPAGPVIKFIKEEPQDSFCDGHEDISKTKKEPYNPIPISELRPSLEVNFMKPDLGKIQEIRSRLNDDQKLSRMQAIAKRTSENESSGLKTIHGYSSGESCQPSTSQSNILESASLSKSSKTALCDDDEPLDVRRRRLKRSFKSSEEDLTDAGQVSVQLTSSVKKVHERCININSKNASNDQKLSENEVTRDACLDLEPDKSPGRDYDDLSESQVFEFETQEDIASVWIDLPVVTKKHKFGNDSKSCNDLEPMDTQHVSDGDIERACLQAEAQIHKQQQPQKPSVQVPPKPKSSNEKCELIQSKRLKIPLEKSVVTDKGKRWLSRKPPVIEALSQKIKKQRRSHNDMYQEPVKPCSSSMLTSSAVASPSTSAPSRGSSASSAHSASTPAVVPPKKVRKHVEPESVAERLGLKKKERKAFDLSQRSLVSLGELRSHGQNVHVEPQQKTKRVRQQKVGVKKGKKLLASQDFQYFRQSRVMLQKSKSAIAVAKPNKCPVPDTLAKSKAATEIVDELTDEDEYFLPCSQPDPARRIESYMGTTKANTNLPDDSKCEISDWDENIKEFSSLQNKVPGGSMAEGAGSKDESGGDDDEWMSLTQNEPTDMELCSQMEQMEEEYGENLINADFLHMNKVPAEQPTISDRETSLPVKSLSANTLQKSVPGASTETSLNDHLFLKPSIPTDCQKKAKPSTTKIYAPSSRIASLAKDLEKVANPVPAANVAKAKVARPPPAMRPPPPKSTPQPEFRQPLPPRPAMHASNQASRSSLSNVTSALPSYKNHPRAVTPVSIQTPTVNQDRRSDHSRMFDPYYLKQTILKWDYSMFENYETFGTPQDLCPFPLQKVPTKFSSYQEYFDILYPLLLINTFEEMVSEWPKSNKIRIELEVQGIEYSNHVASARFTAKLNSEQEKKQLYPKDDDLVLLWLPENTGAYANNGPDFKPALSVHFGCVSRSNVFSNRGGQLSTLNITIQTRGNVSSINTQPVRCEQVGSLISTLREFKALGLLQKSKMLEPLLKPDIRFFAPCQDSLPNLDMPEYNADQSRAIGYAIAMVKTQQNTPKILLVHGPPGTGKSKTIVGMLHRILSDGPSPSVSRYAKSRRTRILLCAPSNAAIDSLMRKIIIAFKEKCLDIRAPQGTCGDINLVRLGSERTISKELKLFSLDSQVRKGLEKAQQMGDVDIQRRKGELDKIIEVLSYDCAQADKSSPMFGKLNAEKLACLKERENLSKQLNESYNKKREVQSRLLLDAHVICCTLSTSGCSLLAESAFRRLGHVPFNCVIVDEAGQAKETETLIPLLYRCPNLILVGDPKQLPPTVVSQKAKELGYDQSLMARVWKSLHSLNPHAYHNVFLSVQYRMHPDICAFPSKYIYDNDLKSDGETAQKLCSSSWPFEPYRLFDVTDGRERKEGDSFCNMKEVKLVVLLYKLLSENYALRKEKQPIRVGIITPYKAQKQHILQALEKEFKKYIHVEVDTVDGFQGREIDCIIVSCVRAGNDNGKIGFVGNLQRMNVTITRAKCSLFILGHLRTLKEHSDWGALVEDARDRGTIITASESNFHEVTKKVLKPVRHTHNNLQSAGVHRSYSNPATSNQQRDPRIKGRRVSEDLPPAHRSSREQDHGIQKPRSHNVKDPRLHRSSTRSFHSTSDQHHKHDFYSSSSSSSRAYRK